MRWQPCKRVRREKASTVQNFGGVESLFFCLGKTFGIPLRRQWRMDKQNLPVARRNSALAHFFTAVIR